jgi:hypothetical protein
LSNFLDYITKLRAIGLRFAGAIAFGLAAWLLGSLLHLGTLITFSGAYAVAELAQAFFHPTMTATATAFTASRARPPNSEAR